MKIGSCAVVGGGIAGVEASLNLANAGIKVYLIEEKPGIGGRMAQLDKTFPTNDCSMCILSPKLVEVSRHQNIELITYCSVEEVEKNGENFKLRLRKRAGFVHQDKCIGCGICAEKCPVKVDNSFNENLSKRKAIYLLYPQAIPPIYTIDREKCLFLTKRRCGLCKKTCPKDAIDFDIKDEILDIEIGSIILSLGYACFDAQLKPEYGYKKYKNVLTSIEFERILSASGPFGGKILKLSDNSLPKKIAWIQCIGSREIDRQYCSSVCCMYATKQAIITKEHHPEIECDIFFMELRAFSKGYEKYIKRAKDIGINYIRSRPVKIEEDKDKLLIEYLNENDIRRQGEYDIVVLSIGITPASSIKVIAHKFGIKLNESGFFHTELLSPIKTAKEAIFVGGVCSGPRDIPEVVTQGAGCVAEVSTILKEVRGQLVEKKEYPPMRDITSEPPHVGIFICHCGVNIASVVDIAKVVEYAKELQKVVYAQDLLYACSPDALAKIKEKIIEYGLNRVVVGCCSPATHEFLFQDTLSEVGLNPYLVQIANIRNQCSWVHMEEKEEATLKAEDLVRLAHAKVLTSIPLKKTTLPVIPKGLVIGGGLSGLTAALQLANCGFEVYLVEKSSHLGGLLKNIYYTPTGKDIQEYLKSIVEEVENNPLISVYKNAVIEEISGYVGNFKTRLITSNQSQTLEIEHGIIILATGAKEYIPTEYLYGQSEKIITQRELEERIFKGALPISDYKSIVMIQCVGSRESNGKRGYCSRVCCAVAVKNALKIKELNKDIEVYVLYRDIRTYGFKEEYYAKAREEGVVFMRYEEDKKPQVKLAENNKTEISVFEQTLQEEVVILADLVVLSAGIEPNPENRNLAGLLKVPLNEDGFFCEAHIKLRPVDFANDGIFLAGLAHSPKAIDETIQDAKAAVSRALTLLSKEEVEAEGIKAVVNKNRCSGCGLCEQVCPYSAIELDKEYGTVKVKEALCKGCGLCAATCRSCAIDLLGYSNEQIFSIINAF